jgi:Transcriptional regulators
VVLNVIFNQSQKFQYLTNLSENDNFVSIIIFIGGIMVTQQDVAKKAGVSFITVSRVINKQGYVKEETRQKVLNTIKELNYYPNYIGRALHIKTVNTIGILIPSPAKVTVHATDYYNLLMAGVDKSTAAHNQDLLLSTYRNEDSELDYLRLYFQGKVDGLLLITPNLEHPQIAEISRQNIPCVIIGNRPTANLISYVDSDNFTGMYQLTEYLIHKGHHQIAFVKVSLDIRNANDRLEGFRAAMKIYNLPVAKELILDGDFTPESGQAAFKKLLSSGTLPSAIICANDLMAMGVLSEIKNAGMKVPEDLALAGFDGIGITAFSDPPLTTVSQPLFDMGYLASEILFSKIQNPEQPPESKIFPVGLIKRKSA